MNHFTFVFVKAKAKAPLRLREGMGRLAKALAKV